MDVSLPLLSWRAAEEATDKIHLPASALERLHGVIGGRTEGDEAAPIVLKVSPSKPCPSAPLAEVYGGIGEFTAEEDWYEYIVSSPISWVQCRDPPVDGGDTRLGAKHPPPAGGSAAAPRRKLLASSHESCLP